jgi:hypothetical protein
VDKLEDFLGGIMAIAMLHSIVAHPNGAQQLADMWRWAIEYQPDWELYASRFTD